MKKKTIYQSSLSFNMSLKSEKYPEPEEVKPAVEEKKEEPIKEAFDGVISYHTFIFPFLWDVNKNKKSRIKRSDFEKCLNKNWWDEDIFKKNDPNTDELYNQYRYFNSAARNAIYYNGNKTDIVKNFKLNIKRYNGIADYAPQNETKGKNNKFTFDITKGKDKYSLKINDIRLKLFNSGIGMLIYELENYDYPAENDINKINDFGRRMYMPFKSGSTCLQCADTISICYDGVAAIASLISGNVPDAKKSENGEFNNADGNIELPSFITELLKNDTYSVTTQTPSKNKFKIEPIIGDRMFVACIYRNKELLDKASKWVAEDKEYTYLNDALKKGLFDSTNIAARIYQLYFVDGCDLTCISKPLLHRLLEEHTFDRWVEYGTLTGITEYSMVTLMNSFTGAPHVVVAFLTEYIEMIELVLAQRASLLVFERLLSDSSLNKTDIKKVQNRYIHFQSELLLEEVTPEQQGIEIYKELRESLFIKELGEEVTKQVDSLFALKNYNNDSVESSILFFLACLGVFEAVDTSIDWGNHALSWLLSKTISDTNVLSDITTSIDSFFATDRFDIALAFLIIIIVYIWKKKKQK